MQNAELNSAITSNVISMYTFHNSSCSLRGMNERLYATKVLFFNRVLSNIFPKSTCGHCRLDPRSRNSELKFKYIILFSVYLLHKECTLHVQNSRNIFSSLRSTSGESWFGVPLALLSSAVAFSVFLTLTSRSTLCGELGWSSSVRHSFLQQLPSLSSLY